jgi:hypothetical protein
MEEFGDQIDCYGEGAGNYVESKFEVLKDYQFCVIVESCILEGYVSEKFIDAVSVGVIPLYYGSKCIWGVDQYLNYPRFCVLKFDSISGLDELLEYKEKFHKYFPANKIVEYNLEHATLFRICEDWIYLNHGDLFNEQR